METRGKSNADFRHEVKEILARHESNFEQIHATLQIVLTEIQGLRLDKTSGGIKSFGREGAPPRLLSPPSLHQTNRLATAPSPSALSSRPLPSSSSSPPPSYSSSTNASVTTNKATTTNPQLLPPRRLPHQRCSMPLPPEPPPVLRPMPIIANVEQYVPNGKLSIVPVKGTDGKTTLLHFVVQEISKAEGLHIFAGNRSPARNLLSLAALSSNWKLEDLPGMRRAGIG